MFIPRKFKTHKLVLWLFAVEFPFVLAILILTGIASHNTYQTDLWLDGSMNGFNSAPNQIVYALTNGQSYTVPMVWSTFLQNYNLVIGVLSVFLLLSKAPMHVLRILYPPLSVFIHGALTALFIASLVFQTGSDLTDPTAPQHGPPWYITKSCSVAYYSRDIGYCEQAKSLFAVCICISVVYFVQFVLAFISCFSNKEEREAYRLRQEEKKEEQEAEERALREYEEILKSPTFGMPMTPATGFPGMLPMPMSPQSPMMFSPHTQEFFAPQPANSFPVQASNFSMPMNPLGIVPTTQVAAPVVATVSGALSSGTPPQQQGESSQPYFPPPPKAVTR